MVDGGTNTLIFSSATSASTINLTTGATTGYRTDTISNFQNVTTSGHGDTIVAMKRQYNHGHWRRQ